MECNSVITPTETRIKLQINRDEKEVDPTLYKQIVGSLGTYVTLDLALPIVLG